MTRARSDRGLSRRNNSPTVDREPVARPSDGVDRGPSERPVDLATQVADVDLDDVGIAVEVVIPDVAEDLTLRPHLPRVSHEVFENRELTARQLDVSVAAGHPARARVEAEVTRRQHGRALGGTAAYEGSDARDQHGERERLGDVVVSASLERLDLVLVAISGRQHEDRRPVVLGAQCRTHLPAAHAGHHQVEHDGVVRVLARHPEPVDAVVGHVDRESFGHETTSNSFGEGDLVVDDQDAHRPSLTDAG